MLDTDRGATSRIPPDRPVPTPALATARTVREFWLLAGTVTVAVLLRLWWVWAAISHVGVKKIYGGFEVAFVGAALARGQGFSCLYGVPSGPTTTFAPLYPLLVGLAFRLFHVFSAQAAWFLFAFNIACEALTVILIYHLGRRCFGQLPAFAAALIWAVDFGTVVYSVRIWYSSISALLVVLAVASYIHLLDSPPRTRDWVGYGLLWGITALTNTSLILIMPLCVAALLYRWGKQVRLQALVALMVFACALVPWTVRNYFVFHKVIPIRGNFGAMLWYGNRPDVKGPADESMNPTQNWDELQDYLRLGDAPYAASRQQMAMQFIRQNPVQFVRLTRDRIFFFWGAGPGEIRTSLGHSCWAILAFAGLLLMLYRDSLRALVFASALLFYPLPFYVTLASTFFRYPINPLVTLLAVYACVSFVEFASGSPFRHSTSRA